MDLNEGRDFKITSYTNGLYQANICVVPCVDNLTPVRRLWIPFAEVRGATSLGELEHNITIDNLRVQHLNQSLASSDVTY